MKDICLVQDSDAFRSEWRLGKVVDVYPDRFGNVRNVEILVKPKQPGSGSYVPSSGYQVKRHVSKLIVLVPVEDQDFSVWNDGTMDGGVSADQIGSSQDTAVEATEDSAALDLNLARSVTADHFKSDCDEGRIC